MRLNRMVKVQLMVQYHQMQVIGSIVVVVVIISTKITRSQDVDILVSG